MCLWAPCATSVGYGIFAMGAYRRALLHFRADVCLGASGFTLGCLLRRAWGPGLAVVMGWALAGLLTVFNVPMLGGGTLAERRRREQAEQFRQFEEALSEQIPGTLLLRAVLEAGGQHAPTQLLAPALQPLAAPIAAEARIPG